MSIVSTSSGNNMPSTDNLPNPQSPPTRVASSAVKENIKWENFNYPPLIRLIHYDLQEIKDPNTKRLVHLINLTFLLNCIVCFLNFINAIAQVAVGYNGLRILFSVLNILIFVPFTLFSFYKGYRGLVYNRRELRFYYIGHFLCAVCFFIFSIISGGTYNGWTRLSTLFSGGDIFQGLLAIVESLIYLANSLLCVYCMYKVYKTKEEAPAEDRL